MPMLDIFLDGEGMIGGTPLEDIINIQDTVKVGGLANGMDSGKPSVAFAATLPDGKVVLIQTSLSLFLMAADAMKARYGDPRTTVSDGTGKTFGVQSS